MRQISGHFEMVHSWITQKSVEIKEVSLMLRDADFKTHRYSYHFPEHTNQREKILPEIKTLFQKLYTPDNLYRSTGVTFF